MDAILTCKFKNCNRYYLKPVTLPCGFNLCEEHLMHFNYGERFDCEFCNETHEIPEFGFSNNSDLTRLLNLNLHLNQKQQALSSLLEELSKLLKEIDLTIQDPDNFLFDYFYEIRNEIDKHRESIKLKIDLISDDMIDKLKNAENECKTNFKHSDFYLNKEFEQRQEEAKRKWSDWKEFLRSPTLEESKISELISDTENAIQLNRKSLVDYKNKLLNEQDFSFSPKYANDNIFGELKSSKFCSKFNENSKLESCLHSDEFDSRILSLNESIKLFELCEFDQNTSFRLIYRATADGFGINDFYRKCDRISKTLLIVKVKESPHIFGAYKEVGWKSDETSHKQDRGSFIFSLTNTDKRPIKIVNCNSEFKFSIIKPNGDGIKFGNGYDILISSNSDQNRESYSNLGKSYKHDLYPFGSDKAKCLLAGSYNFSTSEIEVFALI